MNREQCEIDKNSIVLLSVTQHVIMKILRDDQRD